MELGRLSAADQLAATIDEARRLAALAQPASLGRPIAGCPGWDLRDLVVHVGTVHRWVTHMTEIRATERVSTRTLDLGVPESGDELAGWLEDGARALVAALARRRLDDEMWTWGDDHHVRWWYRRMVHETAVHRADAELALGREPGGEPAVAADGVDELFDVLPAAASFTASVRDILGSGELLGFAALDTGDRWTVQLQPAGFEVRRDDGRSADVETAAAQSVALELLVYRRIGTDHPGISVSGATALLDFWLSHAALG